MKILQIIENMEVGGAQRTVKNIMKSPFHTFSCATFGNCQIRKLVNYDFLLLHLWCKEKTSPILNWPDNIPRPKIPFLIFNHDWRGVMSLKAKHYVVYSDYARRNCVADAEISVINPGIELEKYQNIDRKYSDNVVVGRLSTMHQGKISVSTIDFWRQIPAMKFLVGGDGYQRSFLKKEFKDDPRFEFPGLILPSYVPEFLREIDIFLYDTNTHTESFCYVILEAMASGCVVVAKNKGAIFELIDHGHNGFLYEDENEALLYSKQLIEDKKLRHKISLEGKRTALNYSLGSFHTTVAKLFL